MARYKVYGTCMEHIASLCIIAETPEQAREAWDKAFPDYAAPAWYVQVWDLDGDKAWLEKQMHNHDIEMWEGDGYTYQSGGYDYCF